MSVSFTALREALEASWSSDTAHLYAEEEGNPSLGQCYVTAKILQEYFPEFEIVEGIVETPNGKEKHFWNRIKSSAGVIDIDLTWQQFPVGSKVVKCWLRNRQTLNDGEETQRRLSVLRERVKSYLGSQ